MGNVGRKKIMGKKLRKIEEKSWKMKETLFIVRNIKTLQCSLLTNGTKHMAHVVPLEEESK